MSARGVGPGFTWDRFFRALGEIESGNDLYAVGDISRAPAEYRSYFFNLKRTQEHVKRGLGQHFKRAYGGSPKIALGFTRYLVDTSWRLLESCPGTLLI